MPVRVRPRAPAQEFIHSDSAMTPAAVETTSLLTCPDCGHASMESMPTDACMFFFECKGCGVLLRPKPGDCCVFCSYGTHKCPPIQLAASCCASE